MKKILPAIIILVTLITLGSLSYMKKTKEVETVPTTTQKSTDVKNSTYSVDGNSFTLVNGKASIEVAPGSATKNTLSIFGEPVYGDLNGDGKQDAALLLENNPGGSGMFYYAVLAIANGDIYTTTNTLLLGDRVAPQTVEIRDGRAIFNYAERKAGEPMATQPSVGKSLFIHYDAKTGTIGELVQNFEGEADPSRMTLGMKKWTWVSTKMNDGKVTTPNKKDAFTITFNKDGNASITTDCNGMGGGYTVKGNTLTFGNMISTMMFCEGSQEQEFAAKLAQVASYLFTSKGELILEIKMDSGTMIFK